MKKTRIALALGLLAALHGLNIWLDREIPLLGDEVRYVGYAENLLRGSYAHAGSGLIENGPGYPLYLAPFLALGLEGPELRFTQIPLVLVALAYFAATLARRTSSRSALLGSAALALYPPMFLLAGDLLSEPLAVALIAGFGFHFLRWYERGGGSATDLAAASAFLGAFALTKVTYGYAIAVLIVALAAARLLPALRPYLAAQGSRPRRPEWVFLGALVFCSPYLVYTYQLTGKVFYWGTNGGDVLYWMTVGGTGLFGTWLPVHQVREHPDLAREHLTFLETTQALPAVEGDERFKQRALENLRARPEVYAANWVGNVARLLFNYPWSRRQQSLRTYGYLLPNIALLLAFGASLYPAFRNRAALPPALTVLLAFVAIAVAIHSLVSSTGRLFVVNIPVLLLWVFFVFHHFVSVEVREVAAS